jgi:hypothetical protein
MLSNEILEKVFADEEMQTVPIGYQATVVSVFEKVLTEIKEENEDATLSTILSDTVSTEFTEPNTEFAESTGSISGYVESAEYEPTEYESSTNYDY